MLIVELAEHLKMALNYYFIGFKHHPIVVVCFHVNIEKLNDEIYLLCMKKNMKTNIQTRGSLYYYNITVLYHKLLEVAF